MTDKCAVAVVKGGILIFTTFKNVNVSCINKSIFFYCGNKVCGRRLWHISIFQGYLLIVIIFSRLKAETKNHGQMIFNFLAHIYGPILHSDSLEYSGKKTLAKQMV